MAKRVLLVRFVDANAEGRAFVRGLLLGFSTQWSMDMPFELKPGRTLSIRARRLSRKKNERAVVYEVKG